jgi:hypothetical protein
MTIIILIVQKKYYVSTNFVDITLTLDNESTPKFYVDTDINTKQDTITDGSLTIARTDGLQTALNGKQATITTSTDLTCDSIATSSEIGSVSSISGFGLTRFNTNIILLYSDLDEVYLFAYNKPTGVSVYQSSTQVDFKVGSSVKLSTTSSGVKVWASTTATEALDVAGNILASGSITASSVIINGDLSVSGLITQSNTIRFKAYYNLVDGRSIVVGSANNIPYNSTQYDIGNGYGGVDYRAQRAWHPAYGSNSRPR